MVDLRKKIARLLDPDAFRSFDARVNQRVAKVLSEMDPLEPFMKKFHVVFSEDFSRPEEKLDTRGQLMMEMWGYQQRDDPSFKFMCDWIINTQGNNTLRKGRNDSEWFFGRASIINIELLKKEVGRLASAYEKRLAEKDSFDASSSVE